MKKRFITSGFDLPCQLAHRMFFNAYCYLEITGVIQKVLPVLSTETLLHIWLSTEYYGFRPSSTAVDAGDTWG